MCIRDSYRAVYSTLMQDWLGLEGDVVDTVLGGTFSRLDFVENRASVGVDDPVVPRSFELHQNYPNPFNPSTQIRFDLPASAHVRLTIYDIEGRRVTTLVDRTVAAGSHAIDFHADALPSGTYLYQLQTGSSVLNRKMILAK